MYKHSVWECSECNVDTAYSLRVIIHTLERSVDYYDFVGFFFMWISYLLQTAIFISFIIYLYIFSVAPIKHYTSRGHVVSILIMTVIILSKRTYEYNINICTIYLYVGILSMKNPA